MARDLFALVGKITVDGVQNVEKSLAKIDRDARKVTRSFTKLGKRAQAVGGNLTKFISVPLGLAGGAAIKFGADFEKAMTSSLAIMGNVSNEMRTNMEEAAREVAKTSKFSAEEAAEAYFFLASAGMDAEQSIAALPQVAAFAQAGLFDLSTATDLLTDAQSALGKTSQDAEENLRNMAEVSDVLVKANTLANASVQQFSEALTNKAGSALRQLGKDMQEGVAVLSVFADQGIKGAEAGTQLNIVLRDLQTKAVKNKQAFKEAGVAVFDANGEMNNMADIVQDLESLLGDMSDEQRRATLSMLGFSDKSISATSALLGTSEQIRDYEEKLRSAKDITQEVAEKQLQNFWDQLKLVKDALVDVGLELWETLQPALMNRVIPALKSTVKWVGSLVKWFSSLSDETKSLALLIGGIAAAIGPVLLVFGKLFIAVKTIIPFITALKVGVIALNAAMITNPIFAVTAAIGGLALAVTGLIGHYKTLKAQHQEWQVMTQDQSNIDNFVESVEVLKQKLIDNAKALEDTSKRQEILGDTMEGLKKQAKELGYTIDFDLATNVKLMSLLANKLRGDVIGASKAFDEAMEAAKRQAKAAKENAKENKNAADQINKANEEKTKKATAFEKEWALNVRKASATRLELLDIEKEQAIAKAEELGAATTDIIAFYNQKKKELIAESIRDTEQEMSDLIKRLERNKKETLKIEQAEADRKKQLAVDVKEKRKETFNDWLMAAGETIGQLQNLFAMYYQNRAIEIHNNLQNEIAAINSSKMSAEAKTKAIEKLEKGADKKLKELRREQAKRDKRLAIFQAIINTALGVSSALSLPFPLNIVMAAIVGIMGAVQVGLIAAQPIPLAKGGYVKARPGGVEARVGEGAEDEIVMPMKTGVAELSKQLIDRIRGDQDEFKRTPKNAGLVGLQPAGAGMTTNTTVNLNIGTLIANDAGIKELERRMYNIRIHEQQRRGF